MITTHSYDDDDENDNGSCYHCFLPALYAVHILTVSVLPQPCEVDTVYFPHLMSEGTGTNRQQVNTAQGELRLTFDPIKSCQEPRDLITILPCKSVSMCNHWPSAFGSSSLMIESVQVLMCHLEKLSFLRSCFPIS